MRAAALLLLVGCTTEPGVAVVGARYDVAWDTSGVVFPPGGGWTVTNDLGYTLHVDAGRLVEHTLQLVGCPHAPPATTWWDWLVPAAQANHGLPTDPSTVRPLRVVDLAAPTPIVLGEAAFAEARYCGVHWAVGRERVDDSVERAGPSLRLEGTWAKDGATGAFAFEVDWFQGREHALVVDQAAVDGPAVAVVHVGRSLAHLLDRYDPVRMIPVEGAWQVMVGLVDHTEVDVDLVAARSPGDAPSR